MQEPEDLNDPPLPPQAIAGSWIQSRSDGPESFAEGRDSLSGHGAGANGRDLDAKEFWYFCVGATGGCLKIWSRRITLSWCFSEDPSDSCVGEEQRNWWAGVEAVYGKHNHSWQCKRDLEVVTGYFGDRVYETLGHLSIHHLVSLFSGNGWWGGHLSAKSCICPPEKKGTDSNSRT